MAKDTVIIVWISLLINTVNGMFWISASLNLTSDVTLSFFKECSVTITLSPSVITAPCLTFAIGACRLIKRASVTKRVIRNGAVQDCASPCFYALFNPEETLARPLLYGALRRNVKCKRKQSRLKTINMMWSCISSAVEYFDAKQSAFEMCSDKGSRLRIRIPTLFAWMIQSICEKLFLFWEV